VNRRFIFLFSFSCLLGCGGGGGGGTDAQQPTSSSAAKPKREENEENLAPQRTVQLKDTTADGGAPGAGAGGPGAGAGGGASGGGASGDRPMAVPTACATGAGAGGEGVCTTGDAFAKRLCNGAFPDAALVLMGKNSPFTRMYLRGDVDAWNADGGMSTRARLMFDEEMLVLRKRNAPSASIVVGAGGGYQVMRWDGSCFTLDEGELTTKRPPTAKHPSIPWRRLTDKTKDNLLKNAKILAAYQKRGKECKGQATGDTSKACEQADTALTTAIVTELRGGFTLPTPDPL